MRTMQRGFFFRLFGLACLPLPPPAFPTCSESGGGVDEGPPFGKVAGSRGNGVTHANLSGDISGRTPQGAELLHRKHPLGPPTRRSLNCFFFFLQPAWTHRRRKCFFSPSPCRSKVTAWGKSKRLNPLTFQGSFVGVPAGRTHSIGMNQKELFFLTNWKGHCANRRRKNQEERQTQVLTWKWLRPNSLLWPFFFNEPVTF